MAENSEQDNSESGLAGAAIRLAIKMARRLPGADLGADAISALREMAAPHLEKAEIRALTAARLIIDLRLSQLETKRGQRSSTASENPGFTTIEIE